MRSDTHNRFSEPIRSALEAASIPVAVATDPLAPLNDPHRIDGRLFLCLLRLLVNSTDHLAWRTLLEQRNNGVGAATIGDLYDLAHSSMASFSDVLERVRRDPTIISRGEQVKEDIEAVLRALREVSHERLIDLSSFLEEFAADHISDAGLRDEVVEIFRRVISNNQTTELEEVLQSINVSVAAFEQDIAEGNIAIMTMHQAKGLSADAVILVGAEDQYIPGRGDHPDDERRLLYVSLTRARHYLYVTHCQTRTGQQLRTGRPPYRRQRTLTRFLTDAPARSEPGDSYVSSLSIG